MRRFGLLLGLGLLSLWAAIWGAFYPPSASSSVGEHLSPAGTPAPSESPPSSSPFVVRFHPDGVLYVGDQVSLEVISPSDLDVADKSVRVEVEAHSRLELGTADFQPYGIAGRSQATLLWVWDTRGLDPGEYRLHFSLQPQGMAWQESVILRPEGERPLNERLARWESLDSQCCRVHYITHTEAARDLPFLLQVVDEQSREVAQQLGMDFTEVIPITILPRLLGHGGFAGEEIYVSYLDRNYASGDFTRIVHHEMVHLLDARLGGELRPLLLQEGLAVYLSGGHYQREPLMSRAAALLELGWYQPLSSLTDGFYAAQHEIGYLEAGALVQFFVETWGWQAFMRFYRDIHPHSSGKPSAALEAALREHFGLSLGQLEQRFLARLRRQSLNPDIVEDVRISVSLYETVRRYQQQMDPSAYFLTVWLPPAKTMREKGLVADYLRKPSTPENLALEEMLVDAGLDLRAGNYADAERMLAVINAVLDRIERREPHPFAVHPLAMDYLDCAEPLELPSLFKLVPNLSAAWQEIR
jgi:hypothetical protein